jgi:hypothetical protein
MDVMKLRQALAMLNAFTASLSDGDIEEKYVTLYLKPSTIYEPKPTKT